MATDIATLGIRIDNTQVTQAVAALDRLASKGDATAARLSREFRVASQAAGGIGQAAVTTQAQLARTVVATDRATVSTGRFVNAIHNLTLGTVGLNGPMAKIVETMGTIGVGSIAFTTMAIGIAAAATAVRLIRQDLEDFLRTVDASRKSVTALVGEWADQTKRAFDASRAGLAQQRETIQKEIVRLSALGITSQAARDQLQQAGIALIGVNQAIADLDAAQAAAADSGKQQSATMDRQIARLHDMHDALAALNRTFDTWLAKQKPSAGLFTISSVTGRTPGRPAGVDVDLADADRIARDLGAATAAAVAPAERVAGAWEDSARHVAEMVQLMGLANDNGVLLLQNLISAGAAAEKVGKALAGGGALATGDVLGMLSSIGAVISSVVGLFGGTDPHDEESRRIARENNKALHELNRTMGEFNKGISGADYQQAQRITAQLLANPSLYSTPFLNRPGAAFDPTKLGSYLNTQGMTRQDLKDLAATYGITLDLQNGIAEFERSLRQLQKAIAATEIAKFADTFAGAMQAMNASFQVFNTTDPVAKLQQMWALFNTFGVSPHGGTIGQGSYALTAALSPGVTTAAGRQAVLANLQDLFRQLQAGTLTPADLGTLTAQEFLDSLTNMIGLIREAEEAAKQNADALRATADLLRGFSDSLKLGPLTTLSPVQQLVEARRQYTDVVAEALAGDQAAAQRVPALAQAFLEASRAVNASGPAYAADFARVLFESGVLAARFEDMADIAEQQLSAAQSTAANTGQTVTELQALVAQQGAGMQVLAAKLDSLTAEMAENTRVTKQGFEAAGLA